jgi:protein-S-isoprenylcysteine O-methyltransferase Ste14
MKYLSIATLISQISIVVEWAYWGENHRLLWNDATIVGAVMISSGLFVRFWAIWILGPYFQNTIVVVSDHQLIQKGIYKYIRHGSYTGALLTAIGIGVYLSAWVGVFESVIVLGWAYRYRILQEEKNLMVHFGQLYRTYQQQTWMLLPFIL